MKQRAVRYDKDGNANMINNLQKVITLALFPHHLLHHDRSMKK